MNPFARSRTAIWLLSIALSGAGCNRQRPECQSLIVSLNDLGSKLAETRRVTSKADAKPEQVAAALRPFSLAARVSGEKLASGALTVPEVKRVAGDASHATLALASSSASMADAAEQLSGLDAANKAVEDQKRLIDSAEAELQRICDANKRSCFDLAKVLATFPPTPEKMDSLATISAWETKFIAWAQERAKITITDPTLMTQVTNFEKGFKAWVAAATVLVGMHEQAKRYDELTKVFNAQIDVVNKAIGEANHLCAG